MASPKVESCPEPIAYSSDNSYANIDFTEPPMAVFTAQPKFVEVDSILANQLGPVTNPVTTNAQPELPGSPVLPFIRACSIKSTLWVKVITNLVISSCVKLKCV